MIPLHRYFIQLDNALVAGNDGQGVAGNDGQGVFLLRPDSVDGYAEGNDDRHEEEENKKDDVGKRC